MAGMRDKLARLEEQRRARGERGAASGGAGMPLGPERERLAAIRAQLDRALGVVGAGRPPPSEGQWVEPLGTLLPFSPRRAAAGLVHVHEERLPLDERFGGPALGSALDADGRLLALLALSPELATVPVSRALFIDTETSGLGGGTGNLAFLVGMSWLDPERDQLVLEQLLLRDPDDEAAMLALVRERVCAARWLVTYNGKAFDLPLLASRLVMNRLDPLTPLPHLDLLHLARRVHRARPWPKSLVSVARHVLGHEREGDIGGEEVALRYQSYLGSGDEACLGEVVTHNRADVLAMVALCGFYGAPLEQGAHGAGDLTAVARVMRRAGDLPRAAGAAELAVARARVGRDRSEALRARAEIARARGDRAAALADLERIAREDVDDRVRLELAKLYEHFLRSPARALAVAAGGTDESADAREHRLDRLRRKLGEIP